ETGQLFNLSCLGCQALILNHVPEPLRIVAAMQMMHPRCVIDSFGDSEKLDEVVGAEIEGVFGATEVETLFWGQFALGVLTLMALALGSAQRDVQEQRRRLFV